MGNINIRNKAIYAVTEWRFFVTVAVTITIITSIAIIAIEKSGHHPIQKFGMIKDLLKKNFYQIIDATRDYLSKKENPDINIKGQTQREDGIPNAETFEISEQNPKNNNTKYGLTKPSS
jgi:hypothetical protein